MSRNTGVSRRRAFYARASSPCPANDLDVSDTSSLDAFNRLDLRVGTIVSAEPFPQARKPCYQLSIDFGPVIGVKSSSAQITALYTPESLAGSRVLAVANFPTKRIAGFLSEVLVLGVPDDAGNVVLVRPDRDVPNGARLY